MPTTTTYDPKQQLVSFGGFILGGFADDTFLHVERNEDGFSTKVGASGEVTRIKNNNKTGSVKFTTMNSSATNDVLSGFAAVDEETGAAILPFFMKEQNGTTVAAAGEAWIKKLPATERGKELGHTEWEIECAELKQFNGGLIR